MEFSLREWLILVGVIVIVGVLVDGYRRVRKNKRGSLKLAIDKNLKFKDNDKIDFFNGELPNGVARVVRRSGEDSSPENQEILETTQSKQSKTASEPPPPANLPEAEELLPDPLFADDENASNPPDDIIAPDIEEPALKSPVPEPSVNEESEAPPKEVESGQPKAQNPLREVEEVIVISVFAQDETGFENADIMRVILACGMRYGDMDIFHRNERDDGKGAIQFSMANAVKPGTFDLNNMEGVFTPGITFFLSLPGPEDSTKAFDYMLETAQCVAKNLNGLLKDEQQSDMTAQTIEHARQRVRDFERRQLSLLR